MRNPAGITIDNRGRLWVAEMGDYPRGRDGKGAPDGRIKVLTDTDGDGVFDKATLFLDELLYPNGVMPWRDGALIFTLPRVIANSAVPASPFEKMVVPAVA